jgi:threonylcarbamoyladenosine tRNA methylthiotransferase MtaB
MRRPGTLDHFLEVTERAREIIDDVTLTTDVMVGFPGEGEAAFVNTLEVAEAVGFRKLHVFRFSPRVGTPAAIDPRQIDPLIVRDRSERLRGLGDRMRSAWVKSQEGRRVRLLIEKCGPASSTSGESSSLSGLTDRYLRVHTSGPPGLVGRTVDVLVTSSTPDSAKGDILG